MKFALVIIETPRSKHHVRSERADHRSKIERWMSETARRGMLVGGEAFETERMGPITLRLSPEGAREAHPGGFAGSEETLGGFFLIEATGMDEAVALAKTWPTEETIEIRPIWIP